MNLFKDTKVYYFSTQSSSGTCVNEDPNFKSDFVYNTPYLELRNSDDIVYTEFSVPFCILPATFHNINYSNNRLDLLIIDSSNVTINQSILYENGNYTASTFMSKFITYLGNNWTIKLDNITNQFIITNSTQYFEIVESSTIDFVMGFSGHLISEFVNGKYQITMPRTCNFMQHPKINMRCRELSNGSSQIGASQQSLYNDIVISIPNNAPMGGKIIYENTSGFKTQLDSNAIQNLQIFFTDDNDNLIDFNGISSYWAFQFDIYRRMSDQQPISFKHVMKKLSQRD